MVCRFHLLHMLLIERLKNECLGFTQMDSILPQLFLWQYSNWTGAFCGMEDTWGSISPEHGLLHPAYSRFLPRILLVRGVAAGWHLTLDSLCAPAALRIREIRDTGKRIDCHVQSARFDLDKYGK